MNNREIRRLSRPGAIARLVANFFGVVALFVFSPVALLTITARTSQGRLAGWTAVSTIAAIVMAAVALRATTRNPSFFIAAGLTVVSASLAFSLVASAPVAKPPGKTGLLSVFPEPSDFHRRSVWNLIPEVDAVTLGAAILTRIDPWMSTTHARRVRAILGELYSEMEGAPENQGLGAVADYAVAELVGAPFRSATHYYAYVPPHEPGERLGMIVFLHGNAGNHKVMAWAWKPFADGNKVAVVCPTFGYGFWNKGGVEAVERVYQHAVKSLPIDTNRVWLGGISDGGKGVTRSAAAHPEHYRGLIYASPTMLLDELGAEAFLTSWKQRRVLVFQGDDDHNVLKRNVDPAVERLIRGDVAVNYQSYPGEDHFLFFARRDEIFSIIAEEFSKAPDSSVRE